MSRDIQAMIDSMTLEKVPVSQLVPWDGNPRTHASDIDVLVSSMGYFGWTSPILAQRGTNRVIAGHGRLEAAMRKGLQIVPVIFLEYDDQDASGYTIADNATAERSQWDFSKLRTLLDDLKIDGFDLEMTGFDNLSFDPRAADATPDIVLTDIEALKLHAREYRVHPQEEIDHVARNIAEQGFYRDVVVANDGSILTGQEIWLAAKQVGMRQVPVKRLTIGPDDPEALKILVGDREAGHLTEVDDRKLTDLLLEIDKQDGGLLGTGFDKPKVAALALNTRAEGEIPDQNAAAQWVGLPEYERAPDIFKLFISFRTADDRTRFTEQTGLAVRDQNRNTQSCWWPEKQEEDAASVLWEA